MATQYDIVRLDRIDSTQDEARRRLNETGDAILVVAATQMMGRGRQGREWAQPDRGMYASYCFLSDWAMRDRTLIPLVAAVAMRDAVCESFGVALGLRWPNDLMVDGDKVGGILVETSRDVVVVGCGVNLWWEKPMDGAASLLAGDPGSDPPPALAETWTERLITHLDRGRDQWPRAEYESASVTLGRDVFWDTGHGRATAIGRDGELIVDRDGELTCLRAGEVHTRDSLTRRARRATRGRTDG